MLFEQTLNLQLEYQPVHMSNIETNKILINKTPFKIKVVLLILITFLHLISPQYQRLYLTLTLTQKRFKKKSVVITSTAEKERLAVKLVRLGKKLLRKRRQVGIKTKILRPDKTNKKAKS